MARLLKQMSPFTIPRRDIILAAVVSLLILTSADGRQKNKGAEFKYVGGTESIPQGCEGILELASSHMSFKCPAGSMSIPYSSVTLMQYRSDVSRDIRKQKINWKTGPPHGRGGRNHFFTVLFVERGITHAVVLAISPEAMRPYLAEIDLKVGKRVEVQSHEDYD